MILYSLIHYRNLLSELLIKQTQIKFVNCSFHICPLKLVKAVKCLDMLEIKLYETSDN